MSRSTNTSLAAPDQAVDLDRYIATADRPPPALVAPTEVETSDAAAMAEVGVLVQEKTRAATFIQRDFYPLCLVAWHTGVELLPIAEALRRYDWLVDAYSWHAVPADLDRFTAQVAALSEPQGFFLRIRQGTKVAFPVQTCLYMARSDIVQRVHNVIIVEDGAELNLITGCAMHPSVTAGVHLGVTESYIGHNAKLISTMVHSWGAETVVRPRAGAVVEAGGVYVDNYCSLRPAKSIETNPRTWLRGDNASAKHMSIVLGPAGSTIDTGGEVYLEGENSSAELMHRAVCTGGRIYQRGLLVGQAKCRAHVDCAGIVLSTGSTGFIQSVPGLQAFHPEAHMSHEASIGKIAPEQVEYLQTRGLSEQEAVALIIRGFLGADLFGLGPRLDVRIAEIAEVAGHGEE